MHEGVRIRPLMASDLLSLERQPSQVAQLGMVEVITPEQALLISEMPHNFTAWDDDRVAAVFGITETYPKRQGVAWAIFASDLRRVHVALTRFCRAYIAQFDLPRMEAIAICDQAAGEPSLSPERALQRAMANPTPEMRWAVLVGLTPVHVLRKFGAASETYVLCERIAA